VLNISDILLTHKYTQHTQLHAQRNWNRCTRAISLHFLPYLLNICRKFEFLISQRSVATCLRWGGYCRVSFIARSVRFSTVQKNKKSVEIWQSYRESKGGNFLRHSVHSLRGTAMRLNNYHTSPSAFICCCIRKRRKRLSRLNTFWIRRYDCATVRNKLHVHRCRCY